MPPSDTLQDIINNQIPDELLRPWQEFIANKKNKELVALLKKCTEQVCSTSVFRNLLDLMDIDLKNSSYNERFEELAGYLYIFLIDGKKGQKRLLPLQECIFDGKSKELLELLKDCAQSICSTKDFRKILDIMDIDEKTSTSNDRILEIAGYLHIFLIHEKKRQEHLLPWQKFIADGNSKELIELLKKCARDILSKGELRNILNIIDIDVKNMDPDNPEKIIMDICGYIYIFLHDRLKNCPHFAEMFHRGDISRILLELRGKLHQGVAEKSRSGTTGRAFYRRCREALSKSKEIICTTIYDSTGKKKVGTRFAPATEQDVQQAERLLFDFDEYSQLPAPPNLHQKDIRRSKRIVPAALFFWQQAAARKERHAFHVQEFVNYMAAHYDINDANAPARGGPTNPIPPGGPVAPPTREDCDLSKFLEEKLSPMDLAVLQARQEGLSNKAIEKKLGITEHTRKKSMKIIQKITKEHLNS